MTHNHITELLGKGTLSFSKRYAIVDSAATQEELTIFSRLQTCRAPHATLLTGECAWAADHTAPYLLQLTDHPDIEDWLIKTGWGHGWGIFFNSASDFTTLLRHLRSIFLLRAENGRETYFRFYDPVILGDMIPLLTIEERVSFFGPVDRFIFEGDQGEAIVYEKPEISQAYPMSPSKIILHPEKKKQLSDRWRKRLLTRHAYDYQEKGFIVTLDTDRNALTLEDKCGGTAELQKTSSGVTVTTGEERRFQYDLTSCKHPEGVIDPAGNAFQFDVQERHNQERENTPPALSAIRMEGGKKTWVFDHDEMHHLSNVDYPDGTHSKVTLNGYGHQTAWVDRNGNTTRSCYDADERLSLFENANGQKTQFEYDAYTAPSAITFADGAVFGFEYSDAGALKKFLAGNCQVAGYEVDQDGGSWKVNYTDGGQAEFIVQDDRIVKAINATGTVELAYDGDGHLIKETFQNRSTTYHRNKTGQLTGITTPFGQTIHYTLDGENRTSTIHAWTEQRFNIRYSLNGAMERIDYPNGMRLEQNTNTMGLPERMQLGNNQGILFDKAFQRDRLNRVTRISDRKHTLTYQYDKEGRLLRARSNRLEDSESFRIDANANRLADDHSRYDVNAADRITGAGRNEFHYDPLGNLIQGTCPRGNARFTFTDLNRLKTISLSQCRAQYRYDAFGRRVAKKINGITTRYFWAQSQILHEAQFDSGNDQVCTDVIDYLYFPQTPVLLGIRQNQQIHWAAFGHRYETLCLTNEGGGLVWRARYDAFGRAHVQTGQDVHQPFRLPGQYYDPESGLHYNVARYYDPTLGRFLSLDPLFLESGSTNFYAYCNGDPINYIDPSGEFIFTTILIGAAIGAAIGAGVEAMRQNRSGKEKDGWKIAKAALIGGTIGAIGGGIGAAVKAAAAAGTLGTAIASSTLPAMASVGFLSGTGASLAEQCTEAHMTGKAVDPLSMAKQALTDGVIGGGVALVTFGAGGFLARRLRKAPALFKPTQQMDEVGDAVNQQSKKLKAQAKPAAQNKSRQSNPHDDKCGVGEPVNAVTGAVILTHPDRLYPSRPYPADLDPQLPLRRYLQWAVGIRLADTGRHQAGGRQRGPGLLL